MNSAFLKNDARENLNILMNIKQGFPWQLDLCLPVFKAV